VAGECRHANGQVHFVDGVEQKLEIAWEIDACRAGEEQQGKPCFVDAAL
jgi:hypothetical protein